MFNVISLTFDVLDFLINIGVIYIIFRRGAVPIYVFSDVIDNLTRLGKSVMSLYKWR